MSDLRAVDWQAEALWLRLEPLLPGLSVEVAAEIDSTSSELLRRARGADRQPCLLVAEQQTGGRGRQGRPWQSQPGASLMFSLALPFAPRDWSGLSLAVGVALADALDAAAATAAPPPPRIGLKWPNDLWLMDADENADGTGRKLGGILIETVNGGDAGGGRIAVIGIGLNVLPFAAGEVSSGLGFAQELDPAVTAPALLARVAQPLLHALALFEREGFAAFAARFAARDLLFGRAVQAGEHAGVADGIGADGALRLRSADGGLREVVGGEVSVRLAAAASSTPAEART